MTELEKVRLEIVKFMRGKYQLNEVAGMFYDIPCVRFRQGNRTIVSINLHKEYFEFQIIFGKAEREKFEAIREEFPKDIQEQYDSVRTLHDGKWLFIPVCDLETFEIVKRLILLKKKPNRKLLSKEGSLYGRCGHRCDLCVHYTKVDEAYRKKQTPHLTSVYGVTEWDMRCTGCDTEKCYCCLPNAELCEPLTCQKQKGLKHCYDCIQYPCEYATVGYEELEHRDITADDVTWAILPYVPHQYEK